MVNRKWIIGKKHRNRLKMLEGKWIARNLEIRFFRILVREEERNTKTTSRIRLSILEACSAKKL